MLRPETEDHLAEIVRDAEGPLCVQGGATRHVPRAGTSLTTAGLAGITLYEPGALTLVARAGTPLAEIEAALASENQRLPFEPPYLGALLGRESVSSIGGVVATNASGPRRFQAGACRDALLGVRFVDGAGAVVKNGGRVMKNVTGYDLVKLMAGSWGTLGVLSEVAFKVQPRLDGATLSVRVASASDALKAMTAALASPYDVNGAAYVPGEAVYLRVEGLQNSVAYRVGQLRKLVDGQGDVAVLDDPEAFVALWRRLRDVEDFSDGSAAVWRLSMKASEMASTFLSEGGPGIDFDYRLDWAGGLAWVRLTEEGARLAADRLETGQSGPEAGIVAFHDYLQAMCRDRTGGHATLYKAPDTVRAKVTAFQPEAPAVARLSAALRSKFDPRGILNPGLMG